MNEERLRALAELLGCDVADFKVAEEPKLRKWQKRLKSEEVSVDAKEE